jgi:hypothetical protein
MAASLLQTNVPPDLVIERFRIWLHGWQYPEASDDWDSNWLRLTASYSGATGVVTVSGAILDTVSFSSFQSQLAAMRRSLAGESVLESVEPELRLRLWMSDRLGHIQGRLDLTKDHLLEHHWFTLQLDQSDLPAILGQLAKIVSAYPVRGTARRGV